MPDACVGGEDSKDSGRPHRLKTPGATSPAFVCGSASGGSGGQSRFGHLPNRRVSVWLRFAWLPPRLGSLLGGLAWRGVALPCLAFRIYFFSCHASDVARGIFRSSSQHRHANQFSGSVLMHCGQIPTVAGHEGLSPPRCCLLMT